MTNIDKTSGSTTVITGGAGFIGSWIAATLSTDYEHNVIIVDNMSTGSQENLSGIDNLIIIEADVSEPDVITKILESTKYKVDYIYHLASPASPRDFTRIPVPIMDVNVVGTRNMLELCRITGARLLYASTSEVYGDPPASALPLKETYRGNANITGIRGCYDEGKRAGEAYCKAYERMYGIDARITRIFNTYGEFMPMDGRVMPTFIEKALKDKPIPVFGDGTHTRCFTYINDMVDALLNQMFFDGIGGIPINVGSADPISVISLAYKIIDKTDSSSDIVFLPLPEDDPKQRIPDISRAKELLNWNPNVKFDKGLDTTLCWWKNRYGSTN